MKLSQKPLFGLEWQLISDIQLPRRLNYLNTCLTACPNLGEPSSRRRVKWQPSTWSTALPAPDMRAMSSSSSPGVSLMLEGISYIAGTEIPMVLVDVMRGGPGLGNIAPAQADYNQIVHGGGHGDYKAIVLAPASVQESIDLTVLAFDLAEKYRSIAVVLTDGSLGQMMEPCETAPDAANENQIPRLGGQWLRRARTPLPHLDQPQPAEAGRIELPPAAPLAGDRSQRGTLQRIFHGRRANLWLPDLAPPDALPFQQSALRARKASRLG